MTAIIHIAYNIGSVHCCVPILSFVFLVCSLYPSLQFLSVFLFCLYSVLPSHFCRVRLRWKRVDTLWMSCRGFSLFADVSWFWCFDSSPKTWLRPSVSQYGRSELEPVSECIPCIERLFNVVLKSWKEELDIVSFVRDRARTLECLSKRVSAKASFSVTRTVYFEDRGTIVLFDRPMMSGSSRLSIEGRLSVRQ